MPSSSIHKVVGNQFIKQYYGEVLPKNPLELHRFYAENSMFCHSEGSSEVEAVTGLSNIKEKIQSLDLADASVDLDCGSVDIQLSREGGILLMVTGIITLRNRSPRQFAQTVFLSQQKQGGKTNYIVLNDIFRLLDTVPTVVEAAIEEKMQTNKAIEGVLIENEEIIDSPVASLNSASFVNHENVPASPHVPEEKLKVKKRKKSFLSGIVGLVKFGEAEEPVTDKNEPCSKNKPEIVDECLKKEEIAKKDEPVVESNLISKENVKEDSNKQKNQKKEEKPVEQQPPKISSWAAVVSSRQLPASSGQAKKEVTAIVGGTTAQMKQPQKSSVSESKMKADSNDECVLFVRNIPQGSNHKEISSAFEKFGPISNINYKNERNYAHITFSSIESVTMALDAKKLNEDVILNGRTLQYDKKTDNPKSSKGFENRKNNSRGFQKSGSKDGNSAKLASNDRNQNGHHSRNEGANRTKNKYPRGDSKEARSNQKETVS
eukprot:CAMPEP_0171468396 /NCGR_PEP_ID=MMETSP0945-20130129/10573_1 /TAXON_ID=109269 /ORGANISM="Vaucheria litorea, Strain CCMP2940" /LENGTH=489 /DNA_ID=CAMNT_0011997159 /DNA_START=69 /DNA_END=1537 /DNA_ORIENTATION=+